MCPTTIFLQLTANHEGLFVPFNSCVVTIRYKRVSGSVNDLSLFAAASHGCALVKSARRVTKRELIDCKTSIVTDEDPMRGLLFC